MLDNFKICSLLNIKYPILQGGMACLGTAELVSAVSNAGGLGIIGCGGAPPDWVKEQIKLTRDMTEKPFGINVMMMSPFREEVVKVILEEKVKVVTFGGGNPGVYITTFKEAGIVVIPVIASVAMARRLERAGVDAVVAEGMESGGHIGETTTIALVPQVVDAVKIPVIAAGGIADGRGLVAALALGAQGVQIGTRFICSDECIAHTKFKEQIVQAQDRATAVTGLTTGHPVRCLENKLTRQFAEMEKSGAPQSELEEFGKGKLYLGVIQGNIEEGSLMAGQIAGLVKEIKPAGQIVTDIMAEAERTLEALSRFKT
jgi:enoyl-[acyl-carrier protein] reductase II